MTYAENRSTRTDPLSVESGQLSIVDSWEAANAEFGDMLCVNGLHNSRCNSCWRYDPVDLIARAGDKFGAFCEWLSVQPRVRQVTESAPLSTQLCEVTGVTVPNLVVIVSASVVGVRTEPTAGHAVLVGLRAFKRATYSTGYGLVRGSRRTAVSDGLSGRTGHSRTRL